MLIPDGPETRFLDANQAFLQCAGLLVTIFARLTAEKPSFSKRLLLWSYSDGDFYDVCGDVYTYKLNLVVF